MPSRRFFDRAPLGCDSLLVGLSLAAGAIVDVAREVRNLRATFADFALLWFRVRLHDPNITDFSLSTLKERRVLKNALSSAQCTISSPLKQRTLQPSDEQRPHLTGLRPGFARQETGSRESRQCGAGRRVDANADARIARVVVSKPVLPFPPRLVADSLKVIIEGAI